MLSIIKNQKLKKLIIRYKMRSLRLSISKSLKNLKENSLKARKAELLTRLEYELEYRIKNGWYCIFNTLTVNESSIEKVFEKGSRIFSDYVRSLDRGVGIAIHKNWRQAVTKRKEGNEFHTYFAVVERGTKNGRLHIHVIHMMKELPNGCVDPNAGRAIPNRREVTYLKRYWKYGYSAPIAVRFNTNDAFGKKYWRFPVKEVAKNRFESLECKDAGSIIGYIGKYMTKEYDKPLEKEYVTWRTRLTRTLGTQIMKSLCRVVTKNQLLLLMTMKSTKEMKVLEKPLPLYKLRTIATQEYMRRSLTNQPLKIWESLICLTPRMSLLTHVKSMIQEKWTYRLQNYGITMTQIMSNMEGSNINKILNNLEKQIYGKKEIKYYARGVSMETLC
ncbi:putative replication initiation protein [Eel River basin pequenovirus]|uniref:putative replication initiation protein n=1 Tax=Eel River basin pequenovirus TaxID=1609634 RepID=UPI0005B2505F|nr:putative replication initiation protein [Eel River basin pequenovirus]AJK28213.1 putative replication initiation protein [Eel River basin pequenovirus]